jgi:hypothetical protein
MQTRKPTIKANQPTTTTNPTSKPSISIQPVSHQPIKPTALPVSLGSKKEKSGTKPSLPERKNLR